MARVRPLVCLTVFICLSSANIGLHAAPIDCPSPCSCYWVLDSLQMDCSRKGLTEYPDLGDLPVEHLDLSYNAFTHFPRQYSYIRSLSYLDLSSNKISYLEADALYDFDALLTLQLANNSFDGWESINPNEAFRMSLLKSLSLSYNPFGDFNDANSDNVLFSESLLQLELEYCSITNVGGDVLIDGLPNLEHLKLSGNKIISTKPLRSLNLRVLELSNCNLPHIGQPLLEGLPSLERLNASGNPTLQFSRNGDILYADMLQQLDLSSCNIDEINLTGMPNLNTLRLRSNMLRSIDPSTFANNTQLEIIDLSKNSLRHIESGTFAQLALLNRLDLSYNEIAYVDTQVFRSNNALAALNLNHNIIQKFTKFTSNSLRELNLSGCELEQVDVTALSGLPKLQKLDLSYNRLSNFPGGMRADMLQYLDLSNCRLSALRNNSFRDFPKLESLHLNGNRFTNPFSTSLFNFTKYLHAIWVGDNPWTCDCHDPAFANFYKYLTETPQKLKDRGNVRCASPSAYYGQMWEVACARVWLPSDYTEGGQKTFTTIMLIFFGMSALFVGYVCLRRFLHRRKRASNERELRLNREEAMEIRRQNQRMLEETGTPNAPDPRTTLSPPSYEDALRMPKPVRSSKSMDDLSSPTTRARKKLRRSRTQASESVDDATLLDNTHRFRSEEMLSNRDKERTDQIDPFRRPGLELNSPGSRRFSTEESRFPAAHLKAQNLQSAEKIANFQSYENSPYTKRKPKLAEIPPFKRATFASESMEFVTDPEYDAQSKPNSPFARRKPKSTPAKPKRTIPASTKLAAPVEDYFARQSSSSSSIDEGEFHVLVAADVTSPADDNDSSGGSVTEMDALQGKRKKRKNSTSRRASGNFTATTAAAAAAGDSSSNASDADAMVVVQKPPMRETLF